ncbi:hypothetical protein [Caballeronia sp. GAFFF3]|uniref:hypothetical protein n=1 Tax=Caballeronia sp. GAFFF3 TaxID=2921759 RepID=UPI0020284338|nr:hypothetical protein [Caballeronia sp. GAFFF3]
MMGGRTSPRAIRQLGAEVGHREILAEARDEPRDSIPTFALATRALDFDVRRARRELAKKNGPIFTHRNPAAHTRRHTR